MSQPVTVLVSFKLASGKTEADLITASSLFQQEFANQQPGILRRELVRKPSGDYMDIIQFRSAADVNDVMEKEKTSVVCQDLFAVMQEVTESHIELCSSLATYLPVRGSQEA